MQHLGICYYILSLRAYWAFSLLKNFKETVSSPIFISYDMCIGQKMGGNYVDTYEQYPWDSDKQRFF